MVRLGPEGRRRGPEVRGAGAPGSSDGPETAQEIILRHAASGDSDPSALLPSLRRGERVAPEEAAELLRALAGLEGQLREADRLDRGLAYALHRLAFEGQVLLTDGPALLAADPATVDLLRTVQEAVDRVLSGEDIRYYSPDPEADGR